MKGLIRWFVENGVAANLLMVLIMVGGVVGVLTVRQEVFPEFSAGIVTVTVPYPGAAPEEVEEGVVIRVEEAIQDLEGIEEIRSTASENAGLVLVEAVQGADVQRLLGDVKSRVDAIDTFPEEAEEPIVEEAIIRRQVLQVAISGAADERTLKRLGERLRDDLTALPGITLVELVATRPYEISIEVSELDLRRYGLSFAQVAGAVRRASLNLPGGKITTAASEIRLRTEGQAYTGREFERLPLITRADGTRILLGDVARVVDGFADTDEWARFDAAPAVLVLVYRVGEQNALDLAATVQSYLEQARPKMPEGIELTVWQDQTRILRSRLDLLVKNGRAGFVLVALVLALFLRLRLAAWVSLGIPISFLGALALMPALDVSINLISLFAFILVLGIVVDDAIIVGENIYTRYENGEEGAGLAIRGAFEVHKPVIFAVTTSIVAFMPLLSVPGNIGKIMRVVPLIVIPTLAFSLVESLFILPYHLSHLRQTPRRAASAVGAWWRRQQDRVAAGLAWLIERSYRPTLERALEWRYLTLSAMLSLLILTFGMVAGGWVRFNFLPPIEADNTAAFLTLPQGTPAGVTAEMVRRIEEAALELGREVEEEFGAPAIRHVLTSIGTQPFRNAGGPAALNVGADNSASHLGEVNLELSPAEERAITSFELARRWRERVGAIPDAVELTYSSSLFTSGEAINVELSGPDIDHLREFAVRLKEALRSYPGSQDISDSFRAGKRELDLQATAEAEAVGLSQADLARQVRQAFYGEEAQRIQRGRDEVKVMVRLPKARRESLGGLEELRIRAADGTEVPLATAARISESRGPAAIKRTDRRRVVNVTADVDVSRGNANEIITDLEATVLPGLLADYPEIRYSLAGEQEEQRQTLTGLARGFVFALIVIYGLLAIPFRSYLQPLIVMSAIPFGLIGAIWGHVAMGLDLAILSFFGIVALTGVVVNDSLVLVTFINRAYRDEGLPLERAIRDAGGSRFRPILLTSLTTFFGLTPLLLEKSMQAQFLIPMAVSLAFGVLFGTFIILLLVPCLYAIQEDVKAAFRRLLGNPAGEAAEAAEQPG